MMKLLNQQWMKNISMEQIIEISLPTAIICFGVFFIVLFIDFILAKIWMNTNNTNIRSTIKWVWTMWLPLWPIVLGIGVIFINGIPMPIEIAELGPVPGPSSIIYGAFCGLIAMAVVKAIKHALEKKGIDITIPDLDEAKLLARQDLVSKKLKNSNNIVKHNIITEKSMSVENKIIDSGLNNFTENED